MPEAGEIDALFTANVPQPVLDGTARNIVRLLPDYEPAGRAYYQRTGIYPMMHPVVMRSGLISAHPGLARAVYDGFPAAKEAAAQRYAHARRLLGATLMLPWADALLERNAGFLPADPWPYGTKANRHAIDTFLRYRYEQGLSPRRLSVEEVLAPELLDT